MFVFHYSQSWKGAEGKKKAERFKAWTSRPHSSLRIERKSVLMPQCFYFSQWCTLCFRTNSTAYFFVLSFFFEDGDPGLEAWGREGLRTGAEQSLRFSKEFLWQRTDRTFQKAVRAVRPQAHKADVLAESTSAALGVIYPRFTGKSAESGIRGLYIRVWEV